MATGTEFYIQIISSRRLTDVKCGKTVLIEMCLRLTLQKNIMQSRYLTLMRRLLIACDKEAQIIFYELRETELVLPKAVKSLETHLNDYYDQTAYMFSISQTPHNRRNIERIVSEIEDLVDMRTK